ncbi:MAG: hypothetical protein NC393_10325 [Clostridium sp.]|nr:hypothetical protein [Clostridium sp.]MCM1207498.1 hypothetical protein [Ruminococcus sp.]
MIFPDNVHKRAANAKKLLAQDKTAIVIQLFFIANIVLFFALRLLFTRFLGLSVLWALVTQLILFIAVGIVIFRVFIFREDEKIQEYQDQQGDSFARFLYVRKDNIRNTEVQGVSAKMFEYTNGCVMATIRFKFGSNDDVIAANTRRVLELIYGVISNYNFIFRTDTMTGSFENSKEYKKHLQQINSIADKELSFNLRLLSDTALKISKQQSNTDVLYLTITSKMPGDVEMLNSILNEIMKILSENVTCFREIAILGIDELLEFYRDFYNIEAIDLAMMKAIDLSTDLDKSYTHVMQLYSLRSTDGKTYRVNDDTVTDRFRTKERKL